MDLNIFKMLISIINDQLRNKNCIYIYIVCMYVAGRPWTKTPRNLLKSCPTSSFCFSCHSFCAFSPCPCCRQSRCCCPMRCQHSQRFVATLCPHFQQFPRCPIPGRGAKPVPRICKGSHNQNMQTKMVLWDNTRTH